MRILIDALTAQSGGGVTYIRHMLPALAQMDQNNQYVVLLSAHYQSELIETLPERMSPLVVDLPAKPLVRRWWFLQKQLPLLLKEKGINVFFAVADGSYPRLPCPSVMLMRNLNIYTSRTTSAKEWLKRSLYHRLIRQPLVYLSFRHIDFFVFVSASFREQIRARFHIPQEKTQVVYHGVSPIFFNQSPPHKISGEIVKQPYILSVSTISSHKNYETLIQAFAQIANQPIADSYQLYIAGSTKYQPTYQQRLIAMVKRLKLMGRVHFLGHVEHAQLVELYKGATAFVLPTRLETFGQPFVEAMASAIPVIASNLSICRDICQDAALYFDCNNSNELASILVKILSDVELRRRLSQRGQQRAQYFSWERSAQEMIEIFEKIGG